MGILVTIQRAFGYSALPRTLPPLVILSKMNSPSTPDPEQAQPTPNSTPPSPKSIKHQVREQLSGGLGGAASSPSDNHGEWARLLYVQYTVSFLNDNNRIWTTATIFIPLSLAGLLSLQGLSLFNTFLLSLGSCLLMGFWVIIADHHRAFQTAAKEVTKGIEEHAGFQFKDTKSDRSSLLDYKVNLRSKEYEPFYTVQKVRYLMFKCVVGIWVLALLGKSYEKGRDFYQAHFAPRVILLHNFIAYHAVSVDSVKSIFPPPDRGVPTPATPPAARKP